MTEPDWDDPKVQASWFANQRALAEEYLRRQRVPFGSMEPEPAWSVAPYVAFWRALGGRTGEPVFWVISGDLPTDFLPSEAAATPRAAAAAFAERWRTVAGYMRDGRQHPTIHVGASQDQDTLAPLLQRRADTLAGWATNDEYW